MNHDAILAKGAIIGIVGLIFGMFLAYAARFIIGRYMGPEIYGNISIGLGILGFFTVLSLLGFNKGVTCFIAFYKEKKDLIKVNASIKFSLKYTFFVAVALSIILFLSSEYIAINIYSNKALINVLRVFSFALPFAVLMWMTSSIFLGFKDTFLRIFVDDVVKNTTIIIFVFLAIVFNHHLFGTAGAFMIGFLVSGIFGLYLVNKKYLSNMKDLPKFSVRKELIMLSAPLMVMAVLGMVIAWTDILMLGFFEIPEIVGVYAACLDLMILTRVFLIGSRFIFTPVMTGYFANNDLTNIRKSYRTVTRWVFLMTIPVFAFFILYPENVLNFFFGEKFISGANALRLIGFGSIAFALTGQSSDTIMSSGRTKIIMYISVVAVSTNVILNLILIPVYGMIGAAMAMMTSMILAEMMNVPYIYKNWKIWPWSRNCFTTVLSGLVATALTFPILSSGIDIMTTFVGVVLFLIIYLLMVVLTHSLTEEDWEIIGTIFKRFKR